MTRNIASRAARAAAITIVIAALSAGASALNNTVLSGLDSPRGLAVGPGGRLIYAEGSGAISELIATARTAAPRDCSDRCRRSTSLRTWQLSGGRPLC